MTEKVEVEGVEATDIIDVDYGSSSTGDIGEASITLANTRLNRTLFSPADDVVISRPDPDDPGSFIRSWSGEVISKPSNESRGNLQLEVTAESKTAQLEYAKLSRPFVELTSDQIIRRAVEERRIPDPQIETITDGTSVAGWSSDADTLRLLDTTSGIETRSANALYAEYAAGTSGDLYVEKTDVAASSVPNRRIDRFETRLLINDRGGMFEGTVTLVDDAGVRYVWDLELNGTGAFETYELPVEDADITETNQSPSVRYDFTITDGSLPEIRALAIDFVDVVTFETEDRGLGVTTDLVETDFVTTRRFEKSIMEVVRILAQEDGATGYVDENDVLRYIPDGEEFAPFAITEEDENAAIVNFEVDRNFDVRNRVTIEGKDDLRVSFEDPASIQFYNTEAPKEQPIDAPSVRTREQAKRRARGFLNDKAWDDGAVEVTSANAAYADTSPGQVIPVEWPSEDVSNTFLVSEVGRTSEGYVTLSLSGRTNVV